MQIFKTHNIKYSNEANGIDMMHCIEIFIPIKFTILLPGGMLRDQVVARAEGPRDRQRADEAAGEHGQGGHAGGERGV